VLSVLKNTEKEKLEISGIVLIEELPIEKQT
jgi:hypothetical protein